MTKHFAFLVGVLLSTVLGSGTRAQILPGALSPNNVVPPPEGPRPILQFSDPEFDHGVIWQGDVFTHRFPYRNVGDATLEFRQVKGFCGCTRAEAEPSICPPGGEGHVVVEYNSAHKRGDIRQSIRVESTDPVRPVQDLLLKVHVRLEYSVDPGTLMFSQVLRGTQVTQDVRFSSEEMADLQILAATPVHSFLSLQIKPVEKETQGEALSVEQQMLGHPGFLRPNEKSAVVLRVTLDSSRLQINQRFNSSIDVLTNSKQTPTHTIQVVGNVVGDVFLSPEHVAFTGLTPNTEFRRTVAISTNNPGRPFHILSIDCPDSDVTISSEILRPGEVYRLHLILRVGSDIERKTRQIRILTDHPEQSELLLNYSIIPPNPMPRG